VSGSSLGAEKKTYIDPISVMKRRNGQNPISLLLNNSVHLRQKFYFAIWLTIGALAATVTNVRQKWLKSLTRYVAEAPCSMVQYILEKPIVIQLVK
jgi:hypothetical protein